MNSDVLSDRHPLDEPEILVDESDRQRIRSRMDRFAGEQDLAGVGFVDPGQYFDQRRLARAVRSQKRVNLAATDVEIIASSDAGSPSERAGSTRSTIDHSGSRFDRLDGAIPSGSVPPGMPQSYFTPQISR